MLEELEGYRIEVRVKGLPGQGKEKGDYWSFPKNLKRDGRVRGEELSEWKYKERRNQCS